MAYPSLIAASFVLARRYATSRRWWWFGYSVASGLGALVLTGWPSQDGLSVRLAVAAALTFGWVSITAADLLRDARTGPRTMDSRSR